jgi:hypothetical protein
MFERRAAKKRHSPIGKPVDASRAEACGRVRRWGYPTRTAPELHTAVGVSGDGGLGSRIRRRNAGSHPVDGHASRQRPTVARYGGFLAVGANDRQAWRRSGHDGNFHVDPARLRRPAIRHVAMGERTLARLQRPGAGKKLRNLRGASMAGGTAGAGLAILPSAFLRVRSSRLFTDQTGSRHTDLSVPRNAPSSRC